MTGAERKVWSEDGDGVEIFEEERPSGGLHYTVRVDGVMVMRAAAADLSIIKDSRLKSARAIAGYDAFIAYVTELQKVELANHRMVIIREALGGGYTYESLNPEARRLVDYLMRLDQKAEERP